MEPPEALGGRDCGCLLAVFNFIKNPEGLNSPLQRIHTPDRPLVQYAGDLPVE